MALFDSILDWVHAGGSLMGGGGGLIGGYLYRRFQNVEAAAKQLRVEFDAHLKYAREHVVKKTDFDEHKKKIDEQFGRIARGSKVEIHATLTDADERRLANFENLLKELRVEFAKRVAELEDDFDARNKEDRKWNEDIKWTLGKIEGILETRGKNNE